MPRLDAQNWLQHQQSVCTIQLLMATLVESVVRARLLPVLTPSSCNKWTTAIGRAQTFLVPVFRARLLAVLRPSCVCRQSQAVGSAKT